MKNFLFVLIAIFYFCSCGNDYKVKRAVRIYLENKNVTEYKELEWGKLDSVFSPFNANLSYNYINSRIRRDISNYEYIISELKFNQSKNKKRISALRDSVSLLKDSIINLQSAYFSFLNEQKPNRLGIPLKLTYKTLDGTNKTKRFTFILNPNDKDISIGHHLNEFGEVCQ